MHRPPIVPILLLAALTAVGCLKPDPNPRFQPAWEPFDPTDSAWLKSREALLVADCQLHNLYSQALPERNVSVKALVATSIRPPQLDLFASDVLGWILKNGAPDADLVLHLGDAADLGCEGEFESFLEVMESAGKPWFMCPGNHEFFYLGSYDPQDEVLRQQACYQSGVLLTKERFIRLYVASLVRQREPGCDRLASELGLEGMRDDPVTQIAERIPESFESRGWDAAGGFLRGIAWNMDVAQPWRSFIVQEVNLTGADSSMVRRSALLLDSCQYQRRPVLVANAWKSYPIELNCGSSGELLPDQLRLVRRWLEEDPERQAVVMCHHPFEDLAPRTKASLGWLWRKLPINGLVTAHTHKGYFAHHDLGDPTDYLELNIASTTDWPMEWRTLRSFVDPATQRVYVQSERRTLVSALRHVPGFFQLGWEVPIDAPDDYRNYRQGKTTNALFASYAFAFHIVPYWLPPPHVRANAEAKETESQVKDVLLWTYFRLLQMFPTDAARGAPRWPNGCSSDREVVDRITTAAAARVTLEAKVAVLQELNAFERTRHSRYPDSGKPSDDARAAFKVSSAAWASRFEHSEGRHVEVDDELIRVRWNFPSQKASED